VRGATGSGRKLFFQKHNDTVSMPGIKELDTDLWPEHPPMLEIGPRKALRGRGAENVVELHIVELDHEGDREARTASSSDSTRSRASAEGHAKGGGPSSRTPVVFSWLGLEKLLKAERRQGLHVGWITRCWSHTSIAIFLIDLFQLLLNFFIFYRTIRGRNSTIVTFVTML